MAAQEIENYVGSHLRSESVSVCLQGRWGSRTEFENGKACIDEMMAAPWWPGTLVIHVASMSNNFREKVKATYPGVNVTWPSWDASVRAQKDDSTAYKDMLLTGKCHILVAPNGGSTYTYTPTAMYHSVVVRNKPNCSDLPFLPYWKLFPEPKMQLDIAHQCGKVPHFGDPDRWVAVDRGSGVCWASGTIHRQTRIQIKRSLARTACGVYNPYSSSFRIHQRQEVPDQPPKPFRLPDKFWEPSPLQVQLANERITFRDLDIIQHFLADNGYILPRRTTMLSRRKQKDRSANRVLAAAMFFGPVPHPLTCTVQRQLPSLNVPDAEPPQLNVGGCSLAQHGRVNEPDRGANDDVDPRPTRGCLLPFRMKPKDYQVMPLMDPLQWMADRLTDRVREDKDRRSAAMLQVMMERYPELNYRNFLKHEVHGARSSTERTWTSCFMTCGTSCRRAVLNGGKCLLDEGDLTAFLVVSG
eukprot:g6268.t2